MKSFISIIKLWMVKSKLINQLLTTKLNYLPIAFGSISLSELISSDVLTDTMLFIRLLDPFTALPKRKVYYIILFKY